MSAAASTRQTANRARLPTDRSGVIARNGRPTAPSPGPSSSITVRNGNGNIGCSDVGDTQARVRLVAAIDRHQVGGEPLDLARVAQPARVDAADAGDPCG